MTHPLILWRTHKQEIKLVPVVYNSKIPQTDFVQICASQNAQRKQTQLTLCVFNDNATDHPTANKGAGNGQVRIYNRYAEDKSGVYAAGVCTGIPGRGYQSLSGDAQDEIDANCNEIVQLLQTKRYNKVVYSTVKNNPLALMRWRGNTTYLPPLDCQIFTVSPEVLTYIAQKLQAIVQRSNAS